MMTEADLELARSEKLLIENGRLVPAARALAIS